MQSIQRKYARDAYIPSLQELVDFGESVDVRGRSTVEFLDYVTEITEPWHHCILIPSRRWNPWLAMSEALWILAGRNDVASIQPYNQHIVDYSDDGSTLYGAYGARIYHQIDPLIERLRKDPSDRRAVLQIWDTYGGFGDNIIKAAPNSTQHPHQDLWRETKDPPCNDMVFFKLRENKLHMTVINRSNDIHFGLYAVNIPTFGILQEYIAARLGVGIGHQTHVSNSFHVYTDDRRAAEITDRMLYREPEDLPAYPEHGTIFIKQDFTGLESHEKFASICSEVLDGKVPYYNWPQLLQFASYFLKAYREHDISLIPEGFAQFQDWIDSAKMFTRNVWREPVA